MDVPHIIAGRFRIEGEIGKGGMGTVYRATHLGLERPVAVKIIKPEFAFDPDVTERFMREARTMARLRHQHAAMIFDAGNLPDGRHFIVMEFVEGETLSEALARDGRFDPDRAVKIASDVCSVLSEAHALGIIHRDLKPSNIMLNSRGVCVLDFGVAKVLATSADATATHATTGSGVIVGTPRYMSPEQCLGQRIGARSDLYSLGVLIYEMLAGRAPFTDPLPSAVLVKQATEPPPPLVMARPDIPRSLMRTVHALLAKRPEQRPASALIAREMLERSIAKPAREVPQAEPMAGMLAAFEHRARPGVARFLAVLVVLGIIGGALLLWSPLNALVKKTDTPVEAASLSKDSRLARSQSSASSVTPEFAKRIVSSMSHSPIDDVKIVSGKHGDQLVAFRSEKESGSARFFALEMRNNAYILVRKGQLDLPNFRSADWTSTQLDIDGDGYDEVIYTGRNAKNQGNTVRMVVYSPREHEVFSVRIEPLSSSVGATRISVSSNLLSSKKNFLRRTLQERIKNAYANSGNDALQTKKV